MLQTASEHEGLEGDALTDAVTARMKQFLLTDHMLFVEAGYRADAQSTCIGSGRPEEAGMRFGVLGTGRVGQAIAERLLVALGRGIL